MSLTEIAQSELQRIEAEIKSLTAEREQLQRDTEAIKLARKDYRKSEAMKTIYNAMVEYPSKPLAQTSDTVRLAPTAKPSVPITVKVKPHPWVNGGAGHWQCEGVGYIRPTQSRWRRLQGARYEAETWDSAASKSFRYLDEAKNYLVLKAGGVR